ncbi:MAG: Rieske (2Fe-2S) protein [bacterium]|nr:Rieske (2Fe-2S) protein [bacterium]
MSSNSKDTPAGGKPVERRELLSKLGAGAVGAAFGIPVLMSVRSMVPNALYEKPLRFKAGKMEQFAEGPTFIADQRVFVFREAKTFYCIGAVCTHLGCTVQLVRTGRTAAEADIEFHCPCHGSKFRGDGTNFEGPAPSPLRYYTLDLAPDDGQLIVDMSQVADKGWRFSA